MADVPLKLDFGDTSTDYDMLSSWYANIPLVIDEDTNCAGVDFKTAKALGMNLNRNQKPDKQEIKKILVSKLKGLDSVSIGFLVENTTVKEQVNDKIGYWRLRIRPDLPIYDDFVFNNHTIILDCGRKKGRLKVKRISLQQVSRRPFKEEGILEGKILIIDDENEKLPDSTYMEERDFDWLLKLEKRRMDLQKRIGEWEDYLELYMNIIKNKQAWVAYRSLERTGPTNARLEVSTINFSENAQKRFYDEDEVGILRMEEIPKDRNWKPDEDTEEPQSLGKISKGTKIKDILNKEQNKKHEWFPIEIELGQDYIFENEEINNTSTLGIQRDPLQKLPSQGLLVNSIISDISPIIRQQKALERLMDGQAVNPRLEDFVFNIEEAAYPTRDEEIERSTLVEGKLNDKQRYAVTKAINCPDISLIQGPPGTGKTTVIAELCYQTVLRGGKVLLASQSNLAVDNALCRLKNKPEIMPVRIGKRTTEEGEEFLENNVTARWFRAVGDNVRGICTERQKLVSTFNGYESAILSLEEIEKEIEYALKELSASKDQLDKIEDDLHLYNQHKNETAEEIKQITDKLNLISSVLKNSTYPVKKDFESLAKFYPEIVNMVNLELKQLFSSLNSDYRDNEDLIDIGEILALVNDLTGSDKVKMTNGLKGLQNLISKLDLLKSDEIQKMEELKAGRLNQLSNTRDRDEFTRLSEEMFEINMKIDELKKQNSEIRLGDAWTDNVLEIRFQLDKICRLFSLAKMNDIRNNVAKMQQSLQPDKGFEQTIDHILSLLQVSEAVSLKMPDDLIQRLSEISENCTRSKQQAYNEIEKIENDTLRLQQKRKELNVNVDRQRNRTEDLKKQIISNLDILDSINNVKKDGKAVFNQDVLQALKTTFSMLKEKHENDLFVSNRWVKLQNEWVKKIEESEKEDFESIKELYIDLANIVGATCSETGRYKFWGKKGREFDLVIIDEVSKATPPELLMPMLLGKQIVLVGDHQQLPPLFKINDDELPIEEIEEEDKEDQKNKMKQKYEKLVTASYFQEMFENASDELKSRLVVQYRMHPTIMRAINQFYPNGYKLECGINNPDVVRRNKYLIRNKTGKDISSEQSHLIWIDTGQKCIKGSLRQNIESTEEGKYRSRYNAYEVETIKELLLSLDKQFKAQFSDDTKKQEIAIISFYAGQVRKLQDMEKRLKSSGQLSSLKIRIGTVDRFQGMESEIVIVSLVSSPKDKRPTSFVKEFRRINVAFSRAQSLLLVVGSADVFDKVKVEINHDGKKDTRQSYGEIIRLAKECSSGNYFVKGYELHAS